MGGRGGSSGLSAAKGKVILFPGAKETTNGSTPKWDYRGYTQAVDKIESAVKAANTETKRQQVYHAIINQDRNIAAELNRIANGGGDAGDTRVLMKERRRLRQLKAKLTRR